MPHNQTSRAKPLANGETTPVKTSSGLAATFPIVGVGASAGGLEACRKLMEALPGDSGMALILVLHLDPTHESLMVDLLRGHTTLKVVQATHGAFVEPDRLYIIAPGTYLSVVGGALQVSPPEARHGARRPFDFLLRSLAKDVGPRAAAVILSGNGADGSLALRDIKDAGGFVAVQSAHEAGYPGMPQSAVDTGLVDLIASATEIATALTALCLTAVVNVATDGTAAKPKATVGLPEVLELLRSRTAHDFTHYKTGTLQRRVERRMALVGIPPSDMSRYCEFLRADADEVNLLAKDLLINVTRFFRDPAVFALLAKSVIPELVANQPPDRALRVWVPGCSTGEEAYSLAMLFREEIAATKRNIKLQIFASDLDPDAIVIAREGLYPETVEAELTSARLTRFFGREGQALRVSPDLRASVIFTVHDVLTDPPFARLDMISCRNLLIYLLPDAQAKIVALFHFALREGGFLLLGDSETTGAADGRFVDVAKLERLYRHVGQGGSDDIRAVVGGVGGASLARRRGLDSRPRAADFAEICRRMVLEFQAPASALIDGKGECLYFLGPIDSYLKVSSGHPVNDLVAMARDEVRAKLRSAILRARAGHERVFLDDCRIERDGVAGIFSLAVQPVVGESGELLLVCFFNERREDRASRRPKSEVGAIRIVELEQELLASRSELQTALRGLEIADEEQRAIHEEASSANEEYQATNEEMLASKEELQSLNEELTALNSQLHETLDRQRTTANDMQNVLNSTDVATIFLDTELKIRSFTPATKMLFNVIPGDVGRPLADLNSGVADPAMLADAREVLTAHAPIGLEIEGRGGAWYMRRILPYRTQDDGVEGVVITFTDVTERRRAADAIEAAKKEAQLATIAKSRFLAAASHDLRQPLQSLALLHGLLARAVEGEKGRKLLERLDETLGAMTGMLNKLLDINEIEAGTVRAEKLAFPIKELLDRLLVEFELQAQAANLKLHVIDCGLWVESDPGLLEQMIRNLLLNALKYTKRGGIVFGCRRHGDSVSIQICDSGVGIPDGEFQAIFEEYYQLDNAARERSRGLGLGLSIVQRLGHLLSHRVGVRSRVGRGSVFTIEVPLAAPVTAAATDVAPVEAAAESERTGAVLLIEDDPELRALLQTLLEGEGHSVTTATDGPVAIELVARGAVRPDVILTDYNLPNGMNGLEAAAMIQERLHREIPIIVLTGDISTNALADIAKQKCIQLNKPVRVGGLLRIIRALLPTVRPTVSARADGSERAGGPPVIFVVDDDEGVRATFRGLFEEDGRVVEDYPSCEAFLAAYGDGREGCLLIDASLPGMSGIELLHRLRAGGHALPAIMITGNSDVGMAVDAMKAGALDFIEKPAGRDELLASVERALEMASDSSKLAAWRSDAMNHVANLTARQRQIMDLVLAGHPSKNIAADLGISQRTVENHRAEIMKRTGSKSVPALARLALAAAEISPK